MDAETRALAGERLAGSGERDAFPIRKGAGLFLDGFGFVLERFDLALPIRHGGGRVDLREVEGPPQISMLIRWQRGRSVGFLGRGR
jgi:hypothetical protein